MAIPRLRRCAAPLGMTKGCSRAVRRIRARCVRELLIERLPIVYAAAKELRPRGHRGLWVRALGQETPERRVVPAECLARAVAMSADACSQPPDLGDDLLAGHCLEVIVQESSGSDRKSTRLNSSHLVISYADFCLKKKR